MKYFVLILLFTQFAFSQSPTTTIYLIRHADTSASELAKQKADALKNTDLSDAGKKRAAHWNDVFGAVHFDAIYSTDYNRTKQTAAPTAKTQNLDLTLYEPKALSVEKLKTGFTGQSILIVGHSNTIPDLVNELIGEKVYPAMAETEFGNLYIITINGDTVSHQLLKSL